MRILLATLALATFATAQNCSSLSATNSTNGSRLNIALTNGAAGAPAILVIGQTAGSTSINLGLATLDLGVAGPFLPAPLGVTDTTGSASLSLRIPANLPGMNLVLQGFTLAIGGISLPGGPGLPTGGGFPGGGLPMPTLTFCTSNVVTAHVGN
jgi:hypothetical protein